MDRNSHISPKKFLGWKQSRGRLAGRVFLCSLCLWLAEQAVVLPALLSCRELLFSDWQVFSLKLFVEETGLEFQRSLMAKATSENLQLVWPLPALSFLVLFSIVRRFWGEVAMSRLERLLFPWEEQQSQLDATSALWRQQSPILVWWRTLSPLYLHLEGAQSLCVTSCHPTYCFVMKDNLNLRLIPCFLGLGLSWAQSHL